MNAKEKLLIFISSLTEISLKKKFVICETIIHNVKDLSDFEKELKTLKNILSDFEYSVIIKKYSTKYLERLANYLETNEIKVITMLDDKYRERFLCLDDEIPPVIYFKGDINLIYRHCISVVGSRKYSHYGECVTKEFVADLSKLDFVIVSGLAEGIDSIAHRTCLENGGKTIAVIAGGIKHAYPSCNAGLLKQISEKGLVISESFPTVVPKPFMFPVRNRIISALSDCVLVTEAREKSGALITCRLAVEQGKEVCAVCGNINSPSSKGTNNLIKSGGAHFVTSALEVIESVGLDAIVDNKEKILCEKEDKNKEIVLDDIERIIIDLLEFKDSSFEEISVKTGLDTKRVSEKLFLMELDGKITKLPGNYYSKR